MLDFGKVLFAEDFLLSYSAYITSLCNPLFLLLILSPFQYIVKHLQGQETMPNLLRSSPKAYFLSLFTISISFRKPLPYQNWSIQGKDAFEGF